ncbi:hypothetical protein QEV83_10990 [Methylocapsa sp. D3K7]|uniref:hypothetical protein n=1 Tax=Methylocapsa sp. D3K7 TaxID=3041435 RepID=UPI00244E6B56|nr:hypothetical protein [Methylocapsa sp. D3K7]WGJ13239.1 hypothetical protein QEV83_10990 [Methylocapsa sp. D3K7]
MPQDHNVKAAECHEAAAKSHRSAAECHGKNTDKAGLEHATKACVHSDEAHKASIAAQAKSAGVHP